MVAPLKLTRDKLLATAAFLFAEYGYDGTSTEMIIKELGVTRPTFYAHIQGKRELLTAIHEEVVSFFKREHDRFIRAGDSPLARLRGTLALMLEATSELKYHIRVAMAEGQRTDRRDPGMLAWWRQVDQSLVQAIKEATENGDFSPLVDPVLIKHAFWAAVNDLAWWYNPQGRLTRDEIIDQLLFMFSGGCAGPQLPTLQVEERNRP